MHVGIVCPYSLSLPGGVQSQALGLARALRRRGVDARVLGPCDGPPPDPFVTPLGNSVPAVGNGSLAAIAPDPAAALRTMQALREEAFEVVHLHEPFVPGPPHTARVLKPAPLVGTFHRSGASGWYRTLRPLRRWSIDHLDTRVAVSEAAADTARATFGGTYEVLWNGIDVDRFDRARPRPTGGPTALFVGRHEERKGLAVLLDALDRIERPLTLWVAGDGPQTAALRSRTAGDPRVEWLGVVDEAEKARRLRAADVFCAPSLRGESFGVVLLEALAAGAAVVASDLEGYRRVVRPGVDGWLVPPGDAGALAAAVARALDEGGRRGARAAAGRRRVEAFGMDRLAERYLELYERLALP
ncbi:MAG: glycosyltransferase family 4 protein [Acidimicrobiales bacterium]